MRSATFIVLMGALGAAIGWLFAAGRHPERPATEVQRAAPVPPEESSAPADEARPAVGEADLAEALSRDFPPLELSGGGAIRGTVLGEEERPGKGIQLVLEPELPEAGPSLRERIARQRRLDAGTRTTTTDAEGRFAFEGLPEDGSYTIRRRPADLTLGGRTKGIRPGETVELRDSWSFGRPGNVPLRVTLGGRDVPRAALQTGQVGISDLALRLGVGHLRDWTPAEPEIAVWAAGQKIRAFLDAEHASTIVTVPGTESTPVTLELEPCSALFGRLELPPTLEYGRLFALPIEGEEAGSGVDIRKAGVEVPVASGSFRLVGAPAGRYLFGLTLGQSPVLQTWDVEVRQGMNSVTLTFEPIAEGDDIIAVTVTDPEGRGMEGIDSFRIETELGSGGHQSEGSQPIEASGNRYRVRLGEVQLDALALGRKVTLSVEDKRWSSQEIDLVPRRREYAMAYPPQSELEVVLPGWLGSGLEGTLDIYVRHESEAGDRQWDFEREYQDPRPDFLGESRFQILKPGPNVLEVHFTDCDSEGRQVERMEASRHDVVLAPGPNRLEIALPPVHTVEIAFPPELAGKAVHLSREASGGHYHSLGGSRAIDGVERFRLPPGEYSVSVERRRMSFRVEGDARIEFRETRSPQE